MTRQARSVHPTISTLDGCSLIEGLCWVLTQRCGEHILDVGGEDHVAVVLVCLEAESVDHVHHTNDGFKCLLRYVSCRGYNVHVHTVHDVIVCLH